MTPDQFRTARQAKGMTQAKAAAYLGTARNTVSRYERGERPIPPLVAIRMAGPPDELVAAVAVAICGTAYKDSWEYCGDEARAAITATLAWLSESKLV